MPPIFSASPGIERPDSDRGGFVVGGWRGYAGTSRSLCLRCVLGVAVSGGAGRAHSALPSGGAVVTATRFGSTLTVPRPSTTASGDVLVASVHARLSGNATITAPSGWSLIRRDSNAPDYHR